MSTRAEMYQQAIEQVQEAVDALDQARSSMRDAKVEPFSHSQGRCLMVDQVYRHIDALGLDLRTLRCDDCDEQLPCKCAWMQEAAK